MNSKTFKKLNEKYKEDLQKLEQEYSQKVFETHYQTAELAHDLYALMTNEETQD